MRGHAQVSYTREKYYETMCSIVMCPAFLKTPKYCTYGKSGGDLPKEAEL